MISCSRRSVRFAAVGLASNLVLYFLYLLLTWLGLGHKIAMSGLYLLGILQTFLLNRIWTFAHRGKLHAAFGRYFVAYASGYFLNLCMLMFFADWMGLPHQLVQGVAIPSVAVAMYFVQRHWVFAGGTHDD